METKKLFEIIAIQGSNDFQSCLVWALNKEQCEKYAKEKYGNKRIVIEEVIDISERY